MNGINKRKKDNLLNESFNDRELEFKERNSNDNSYIAKYVKQYLEDGISFENSEYKNIKNKVQARNGALTDFLRHQWSLKKDRNESDKHHAQDAIVIACATQEMVQYLSTMSGVFENKYALIGENGEAWYKALKHNLREPWQGFREDVLKSLSKIFVSRAVNKKASGSAHKETIITLNSNDKKYSEKDTKSGIKIRKGHANNGNMLRTDVFSKKNKNGKNDFFLVPIYLSDMVKNKAFKEENKWIEMDESYTFKFSLYMNDLIKVKKQGKEIFGYYNGIDRSNACLSIENHDRSEKSMRGIGVKTQDTFKKYQVDPLGFYTEIKSEKRLPLNKKR